MRAIVLILTAGVIGAAPVTAQRPQTREGFWIGFGFGGGNLNWSCDACAAQSEAGPTGFFRLGGTTSEKVLLGAEINSWTMDIGAATITGGVVVFVVNWYPKASGGLFLKGGLGAATYLRQTASADAESSSGGALLGVGYDIRVARNFSLTPVLTFWGSGKADLKSNGAVVETGLQQSGATLQLGFTFH